MLTTVRVSPDCRNALREIRLGKTYSETVAFLAGRWHRYGRGSATDGRGEKGTTISVSDDCHAVLTNLRDDMGVNALGDVIATLVAAYRVCE